MPDLAYLLDELRLRPEEFYTMTKLPMITPSNYGRWITDVLKPDSDNSYRVDFQEFHSRDGRVSLAMYAIGLRVAPPIDFRYGWNLAVPEQQMLVNLTNCHVDYYTPFVPSAAVYQTHMSNHRKDAAAYARHYAQLNWMVQRIAHRRATYQAESIISSRLQQLFQQRVLRQVNNGTAPQISYTDLCQHNLSYQNFNGQTCIGHYRQYLYYGNIRLPSTIRQ